MNRLETMIKELCPNGVEYKKLGDVASISRGGSFQKKDFCEEGIPCIHYGQIYTKFGLFTDKTITFINAETAKKQKFATKNDIVMAVTSENIDDVCKCVAWLGEENIAVSGHAAIIHHTLNPKFLCYYFHTAMFYAQKKKLAHGTKVMEVIPDSLTDIMIPVPPMEVQGEIVRILDNFTELTARKKQYAYYRDLVLDFSIDGNSTNKCEWLMLGEVIYSLNTGLNPRQFFQLNTDDAENYYITIREIRNGKIVPNEKTDRINDEALRLCNNRSNLEVGDVLFSGTGTIGETAVITENPTNWNIKEGVYTIKPIQSKILPFFLHYVLQTEKIKNAYMKKAAGETVKSIPMGELKKIIVPVPPIEEQERIVQLLIKFDTLCNDISEGLPAEIESRYNQYEYYRDKLLTFTQI